MVSNRISKKQQNKIKKLAKQKGNLSITDKPMHNDLYQKCILDTHQDANEIIKEPIQLDFNQPPFKHYEKMISFWEKWKFIILNTITIVGFFISIISLIITMSAREEAKSANIEATAANERLQETIIKIDSMTQMTGTLTVKMAIVSGAIAKGDAIITQEERKALIELVGIINMKTQSARTAEDWATLGFFEKASSLYEDWEKAIPYFEKAISMNDKYAEAYYNLGNIYKAKKSLNQVQLNLPIFWENFIEYSESELISNKKKIYDNFLRAEKYYKTAIRIKPDYQFAFNDLGALYFEQGKEYYQKAIICLKEALRLNSQSISAYTHLGLIYNNQAQFTQAIEQFQMAVNIKDNSFFKEQAYYHMGNIYFSKDSFPQAIKAYREAINLSPTFKNAYLALGHAFREYSHYTEALENYQQVIILEPGYTDEANYYIGITYILQENYNKANEYFEKMIEYEDLYSNVQKKIDIYSKMGGFCIKKRNFDIAIILFQQALAIDSTRAETYNDLGVAYLGLRNYEEASKYFHHALKKDPNHVNAIHNLHNLQEIIKMQLK